MSSGIDGVLNILGEDPILGNDPMQVVGEGNDNEGNATNANDGTLLPLGGTTGNNTANGGTTTTNGLTSNITANDGTTNNTPAGITTTQGDVNATAPVINPEFRLTQFMALMGRMNERTKKSFDGLIANALCWSGDSGPKKQKTSTCSRIFTYEEALQSDFFVSCIYVPTSLFVRAQTSTNPPNVRDTDKFLSAIIEAARALGLYRVICESNARVTSDDYPAIFHLSLGGIDGRLFGSIDDGLLRENLTELGVSVQHKIRACALRKEFQNEETFDKTRLISPHVDPLTKTSEPKFMPSIKDRMVAIGFGELNPKFWPQLPLIKFLRLAIEAFLRNNSEMKSKVDVDEDNLHWTILPLAGYVDKHCMDPTLKRLFGAMFQRDDPGQVGYENPDESENAVINSIRKIGDLQKSHIYKGLVLDSFRWTLSSIKFWLGLAVVNLIPAKEIGVVLISHLARINEISLTHTFRTAIHFDLELRQAWSTATELGTDRDIRAEVLQSAGKCGEINIDLERCNGTVKERISMLKAAGMAGENLSVNYASGKIWPAKGGKSSVQSQDDGNGSTSSNTSSDDLIAAAYARGQKSAKKEAQRTRNNKRQGPKGDKGGKGKGKRGKGKGGAYKTSFSNNPLSKPYSLKLSKSFDNKFSKKSKISVPSQIEKNIDETPKMNPKLITRNISSPDWTDDLIENIDTESDEDLPVRSGFATVSDFKNAFLKKYERPQAEDFVGCRKTHQKAIFRSVGDMGGNPLDHWNVARKLNPPVNKGFLVEEDIKEVIRKDISDRELGVKRMEKIKSYKTLASRPRMIIRNRILHNKVPAASKNLVKKFNLAIFERILYDAGMDGSQLIDFLTGGFPITGMIDQPGVFERRGPVGDPEFSKRHLLSTQEQLLADCHRLNVPTDDDAQIWDECIKQCELGSIEEPVLLDDLVEKNESFIPTRRFGVWQPDGMGGLKFRPIDNCKRSGLNKTCTVSTPAQLARSDDLLAALEFAFKTLNDLFPEKKNRPFLKMVKGDHKKAYYQIPMREGHKKFLYIVTRHPVDGRLYVWKPISIIFGSVASVIDYNMCSLAVTKICKSLFDIPVISYFDDFLLLSTEDDSRVDDSDNPVGGRYWSTEKIFNEINDLIGFEVHKGKAESGKVITFLGITFDISSQMEDNIEDKCIITIDDDRRNRLRSMLDEILKSGNLSATQAAQTAGKLSFATGVMFGRVGRALLKPFYARAAIESEQFFVHLNEDIKTSIEWFMKALETSFFREVRLGSFVSQKRTFHIITDGQGDGGIGMIFGPGSSKPSKNLSDCVCSLDHLSPDFIGHNKIVVVETLAVISAIETILDRISHATIVVWSDNTQTLSLLARGYSPNSILNKMTKYFWTLMARSQTTPWFEWVASNDNLSDPLSRGSDKVVLKKGAKKVKMVINRQLIDEIIGDLGLRNSIQIHF